MYKTKHTAQHVQDPLATLSSPAGNNVMLQPSKGEDVFE